MTTKTSPRNDSEKTIERNQTRRTSIRMDVMDARTPERYLRAKAYLGRTGIQEYQREDGTVIKELRLPEEVFAPATLESALHKILTDNHPPVMVDSSNTDKYQRGSIIGPIGREQGKDVEYVTSEIQATHQDTIAAIDDGRDQLSLGYLCDIEYSPGTHPIWGEYDAIQRNIRINHVARVDRGRAGPEVRVRFDAQEVIVSTPEQSEQNINNEERSTMIKIRIDGHEVEVSEAAKAAYEAEAVKNDNALKAEKERADNEAKRADSAEKKLTDAQKETAATQAKLDAANDKVKSLEDEAEDIDSRMDARSNLIADAKLILGKDYSAKGKSDEQIRSDAVSKALPELKLDGFTDKQKPVYIQARFDGLVSDAKDQANNGSSDPVLGAYDRAKPHNDADFWDKDPLAEQE